MNLGECRNRVNAITQQENFEHSEGRITLYVIQYKMEAISFTAINLAIPQKIKGLCLHAKKLYNTASTLHSNALANVFNASSGTMQNVMGGCGVERVLENST
jgi:hypothetical protein